MSLPPLITAIRPHQWVKNAFVAAPLFFTPEIVSAQTLWATALAVLAFCFLASSIYLLNDIADREADREHPVKRNRPIASGRVSVLTAALLGTTLLVLGSAIALYLGTAFAIVAALYVVNNVLYSFWLKHKAIIDVCAIAFGFVLRVEAGSLLLDIAPSAWIVIMTGLLALFLALAKRRDDIVRKLGNNHRRSLEGYSRRFLDAALAMLLGALLVAYLIYTTDETVMTRLGNDKLFYTAPFVAYGVLRYLQLTVVYERSGSPTKVVLTDPPILLAVIGWIATFGFLIYGGT